MFGRTLRCSIAKDNGRTPEFIRKKIYKDKSRCYECGVSLYILLFKNNFYILKFCRNYSANVPDGNCLTKSPDEGRGKNSFIIV